MMSSTRSMINAFFADAQELSRPATPPPDRPATPRPDHPAAIIATEKPRAPSVNQSPTPQSSEAVNDPRGLLERNKISHFTLAWQAKRSEIGKGTLDELRQHKREMAEEYRNAAARAYAKKQQQKQAKLDAILASKSLLRLYSQPAQTGNQPILRPTPVRASGKVKIQF